MKKLLLTFFILSTNLFLYGSKEPLYSSKTNTIESLLRTNFNFSPEELSNYIFRRYYFIQRLKTTMDLFNEINKTIKTNNHSINTQKIFEFDPSLSFKHHRIQESIEQIKKNKNFKPLFIVWQDFAAYKSLDDQLFIEEFTKEIFVISKNVFLNTKPQDPLYQTLLTTKTPSCCLEQLLTEIDTFTDSILQSDELPFYFYNQILTKNKTIKPLAHINDVILHFYYIKRLSSSFFFLLFLHNNGYVYTQTAYNLNKKSLIIDSIEFSHAKIISCIKTMHITASLKPLLLLLNEIRHYRYMQDAHFIHEMILLLFITYKHIFWQTTKVGVFASNKSVFTTIMTISETLDQLPIAEVLNAIDMLVEELPAFLNKYEFNSTMTWRKWLRKYWWVPPIVITWFGLKILLKLQHKPYFYGGSFYHPKPSMPNLPITTNDPALLELIN
jgi:hypothetical protein